MIYTIVIRPTRWTWRDKDRITMKVTARDERTAHEKAVALAADQAARNGEDYRVVSVTLD